MLTKGAQDTKAYCSPKYQHFHLCYALVNSDIFIPHPMKCILVKSSKGPSVFFIPPANFVCGGYTVFMLSVRKVLFPKYLEESLLDFPQTLQTCSYMQGKYFRQKSKG